MAFARKTIIDILSKLGANLDQDAVESAADEIFAAHGSSIASFKSKLSRYDSVDLDELQRDSETLQGIRNKLGKNKIEDLLETKKSIDEQLGERKLADVLAENAKYAADIQSAKHSKAVDALLKDCKFNSKAAESFIRAQFDSLELKDDGTLAGGTEKLKEVVEANKDSLTVITQNNGAQGTQLQQQSAPLPQFTSNSQQQMSNSMSAEDAFLMQKYGKC